MVAFLRIVQLLGRYGARAVSWAWANKGTILYWLSIGQGVDWIVQKIRWIVGA